MKTLRIISAALLVVMMLCLPIYSAEGDGLTFKEDGIYKVIEAYEESPNTFEAWIKVGTNVTGRAGVIIGNYGHGTPNVSFEIHSNGAPRLFITDENNNNSDYIFKNVRVNTGQWIHLSIVRDATDKKVYCYVNGELKETKTDNYTGNPEVVRSMCVGGDLRTGNAQYFKGEIRSVAVYSNARTASEIATDKTEYGTDELIALYDLTSVRNGRIADVSGNNYDVRFEATWLDPSDKAPATGYAYSFAVIGDTQVISDKYKDKFGAIYNWILGYAEEKNTKFVFGLGDITEHSYDSEWTVAMNAIKQMDGELPYSLVRGNHDSVATFNKYVSYNDYKDTIDGSYNASMINTYRELVVGELKYLIFTLDYGAADAILDWAGEVIEDHPGHNVIITTHAYLYRDGTTLDDGDVCPPSADGGNDGDDMWEKLIKKHENIVLVLSGHDPCDNIIMTQTQGDNGNTVTQMLIDPQGADSGLGGVGAVAMLYFSEDGKDVTVEYYSTFKDKYFMGDSQFTMTLNVVQPLEGDEEQTPTEDPEDSPVEKPAEKPTEKPTENSTEKPTEELTERPTASVGGVDDPTDVNVNVIAGCSGTIGSTAVSASVLLLAGCIALKKRKRK